MSLAAHAHDALVLAPIRAARRVYVIDPALVHMTRVEHSYYESLAIILQIFLCTCVCEVMYSINTSILTKH